MATGGRGGSDGVAALAAPSRGGASELQASEPRRAAVRFVRGSSSLDVGIGRLPERRACRSGVTASSGGPDVGLADFLPAAGAA